MSVIKYNETKITDSPYSLICAFVFTINALKYSECETNVNSLYTKNDVHILP